MDDDRHGRGSVEDRLLGSDRVVRSDIVGSYTMTQSR